MKTVTKIRFRNKKRVEREVRAIIMKAGIGGGLILSDNHGEISWQMPETVEFVKN